MKTDKQIYCWNFGLFVDFLAEIFRRRNKSHFLAEIFRAEINCDEIFGAEIFRS